MPKLGKLLGRILFVLILFLTAYNLPLVFAESPLEKAKEDYTFQLTKYRDAQEKYKNAKAIYEAFRTAIAKNEASLKTKEYLAQIDSLYTAYLLLISENGNPIDWSASPQAKDKIFNILKDEMSYIENHQKRVGQTQTLEELPPAAQELKDHFAKLTLGKINKILATYEIVRTRSALNQFIKISEDIDSLATTRVVKENATVLANWRSEIKSIRQTSEISFTQATEQIANTKEETASEGQLKETLRLTANVKSELIRARALFEEILRLL